VEVVKGAPNLVITLEDPAPSSSRLPLVVDLRLDGGRPVAASVPAWETRDETRVDT
jgi:hypothetical protein